MNMMAMIKDLIHFSQNFHENNRFQQKISGHGCCGSQQLAKWGLVCHMYVPNIKFVNLRSLLNYSFSSSNCSYTTISIPDCVCRK